jgi:hypothetical protein
VQRARSDARSSGASEAHEPAAEELATAVFVPGKRGPASVIRTVVPPPLPAAALQTAKEEAVDGLHTSVVEEAAWKAFSENKDAKTTAASAGVTALFNHDELARMLALEERVDLRNYADLAELLEGEERAS